MRIVHLSDIHLSEDNYKEFYNNVRDSLISDLSDYNSSDNPIDIIVITGDLVDKGGHSLMGIDEFKEYNNPYLVFEKEFIDPISSQLGISKERFLFIPGNHDIDESEILWVDEKRLKHSLDDKTVNDILQKNKANFDNDNHRIKLFKEFEKEYHLKTPNYTFSNNESTYFYDYKNNFKVGFILVNDSWRCSTCKLDNKDFNKHFFGFQQLYEGIEQLKHNKPNLIICLFHHFIDDLSEKDEVKKFFISKGIGFFLYGHHHNTESTNLITPVSNCYGFRGRSTLNKPNEKTQEYQSGYQIYDINPGLSKIEFIHYRKYEYNYSKFVNDTSYAPNNGIDSNGYKFHQPFKQKRDLSKLAESNFKLK